MESRGSTGCPHNRTDAADMNGGGAASVCGQCGEQVDRKPRPKDVNWKASRTPDEQKRLFPGMESDRLRVPPPTPASPPIPTSVPEEPVTQEEPPIPQEALINQECAKHEGSYPECDSGPGKANRCTNSMWGAEGRKRGAQGPCLCICHNWDLEIDYSIRAKD